MPQWEYQDIFVRWIDGKGWVTEFVNNPSMGGMVGLENICNYFGSSGWELVTVIHNSTRGTSTQIGFAGSGKQELSSMSLLFKRVKVGE